MQAVSQPQGTPRYSIVIPTFNRSASLLATLQSCFNQSLRDFEVIVVDDGSTDDTRKVLAAIEEPRLVVVHQDNAGPAAARNHGMGIATGDYIAFLDSDDTWYPGFLAAAEQAFHEHGNILVYGQIIVDRGVGRYWLKPRRPLGTEESIYDYLYVHGGFVQTSTIVVPRQLACKVRWDESVTFGDNDQFAIACWQTGIAFHMLPQAYTRYTDVVSPDALSQLPIHGGHSEKYTNFFHWMATQRPYMSVQAWAGFRARFETVAMARDNPWQSLVLLWEAYKAGAMSLKGMFRQTLQNHTPRLYRRLVDQYVRWRGAPLDSVKPQC